MDELKEETRLDEFVGGQGTRKQRLKFMHSRPCICAQPCKSTIDLKKSMRSHEYCAYPCIKDRKFSPTQHARLAVHLTQTTQINSIFELFDSFLGPIWFNISKIECNGT